MQPRFSFRPLLLFRSVLPFSARAASARPSRSRVEAIFARALVGQPPEQLTWSPDGKHLTYIDGGELVDLDPASGQAACAGEPRQDGFARRSDGTEQDRDHRDRYDMASYVWAPDSAHLLFDSNGRLWLYDLHNGTGVQVGYSGAASGDDPKFSPDGQSISFIRDHGLAVIDLRDNTPQAQVASRRVPIPPTAQTCSMARSIGSTRKSWRRAATTSGRRIPRPSPICR